MDPVIQAAIDIAVQNVRAELTTAQAQAVAAMSAEIQSIRGKLTSLRNEMTAGLANLSSADQRFGQALTGVTDEFGKYNQTIQNVFDKTEDLEARIVLLEKGGQTG